MITEAVRRPRTSAARGSRTAGWVVALAISLTGCEAHHGERGTAAVSQRVTSDRDSATQAVGSPHNAIVKDETGAGRAEFERRWAPYPSIGGQWGRGPLANADSCQSCHPRLGRGALSLAMQDSDLGPVTSSVTVSASESPPAHSLSAPASGPAIATAEVATSSSLPILAAATVILRLGMSDATTPDPRYGRQFNTEGLLGRVPAEGRLRLVWRERPVTLEDGETVILRWPQPQLDDLAYGALNENTRTSLRIAPSLAGVGWLEQVDAREFARLRAAQAVAGIDGKLNSVPDIASRQNTTGKFGWKASQPSLRQQTAAAFLEDIGVTSSLYLSESCTPSQDACRNTETVPHPELKESQLAALTAYLQGLSAPAPRPRDPRGAQLFRRLQCDLCHADSLRTAGGAGTTIHPYTDLMLHDMGEDLADGLREHRAEGRQWRTPPLWGIGLTVPDKDGLRLLHDGRARDLQEAILWHGGEAAPMRAAYASLPRSERVILLTFLQSL